MRQRILLRLSSCIAKVLSSLQGHVVAEQQLPLPSDWLRWDEDAMEQAPSPSSSPLRFSKQQRDGHEAVLVEGANDLCIEVGVLAAACDALLCSSMGLICFTLMQ